MNYRHAYHAGNFADVMKHTILVRIIDYMKRKEKPFRIIDTHAGIGLYDLSCDEAQRTGEAENGIAKLENPFNEAIEELLKPYRQVLTDTQNRYDKSIYPGSPAIIRELIRREDRAIFVELHPEDYSLLSERYNHVTNIKVMHLDGWQALSALIPPKEKRGLVLIDPPFEQPDELNRMVSNLIQAVQKWPTGIYMAWYPIKERRIIDKAWQRLKSECSRTSLRAELMIQKPADTGGLNGSGLFIINPPWLLADELKLLLPAFARRLALEKSGDWTLSLQEK